MGIWTWHVRFLQLYNCLSFLFTFLVFAGLTNYMLYLVQRYTRQTTYSGCVRKMLGKKAEWCTDLIQVVIEEADSSLAFV